MIRKYTIRGPVALGLRLGRWLAVAVEAWLGSGSGPAGRLGRGAPGVGLAASAAGGAAAGGAPVRSLPVGSAASARRCQRFLRLEPVRRQADRVLGDRVRGEADADGQRQPCYAQRGGAHCSLSEHDSMLAAAR